jgi:hypothetical protein
VTRGEYLVHAQMCGLCHTQINAAGIYRGDDSRPPLLLALRDWLRELGYAEMRN